MATDELAELRDLLVASTQKERLQFPGLGTRRADLIPVGSVIFEEVVRSLDFDQVEVCDWGLREGIVIEAVQH